MALQRPNRDPHWPTHAIQRSGSLEPSKGDAQLASTSAALTKETLGVSIPLEKANQWLTGTAPTAEQLGTWQFKYLRYDEFGRPRILELTQGSTRVRIVVKTWQYSPSS